MPRTRIASIAALGLLAVVPTACADEDDSPAALIARGPKQPGPKVTIVPEGEPGTPLILSGTVYRADGVTPAAGVTLHVHQTDASGRYKRPGERPGDRTPRLRGWVRTGPDGRYEIRTVVPGPYPDLDEPAHVHHVIAGPGSPARWVGDTWFEGDTRITPEVRARALASARKYGLEGPVVLRKVPREGGGVGVVRDFRLGPTDG